MFFAEHKEILKAKENRYGLAESLVGGSVRFFLFSNGVNISFQG